MLRKFTMKYFSRYCIAVVYNKYTFNSLIIISLKTLKKYSPNNKMFAFDKHVEGLFIRNPSQFDFAKMI